MNLLYLAYMRLPTERAHGLQIMETCASLSNVANVELMVPTRENLIQSDPFVHYGISKQFTITTLKVPDGIRFGKLGFVLSLLWFAEKARWQKSFWTADCIYSRDPLVLVQYLFLGRSIVFEAHAKPSFISRIVARRAYRVIVISKGLQDAYVACGAALDRIHVAPDAVHEHLFDSIPTREEARDILELPRDTKIALYAGHLYERKGVDTLAAAAAQLPEHLVVFVGGTHQDVARFKARWGGVPNIMIIGQMTHAKIPLYLRAADVLVLPNSGTDEDSARFTSPMKLFEYMASGTPIVASDVPALREILEDSDCYFAAADNVDALVEALTRALQSTEEANGKAHRAHAKALAYTWDNRAATILNAIDSSRERKDDQFFNAQSTIYSARRYPLVAKTFTQFFFRERLRKTLELLNPYFRGAGEFSVLEVGCADGVVARAIWETFGNHIVRFDANDTAPEMIEQAQLLHGDTPIHFSVREHESLQGSYDVVVEVGVLNYTSLEKDLREILGVLPMGGRYVCSIAGSSSLQNRLKGASGYQHLESYEEYERTIGKYFAIESKVSVGFFIPHLWKVPRIARLVQPIVERVISYLAPSLALEKVYVLKAKPHE